MTPVATAAGHEVANLNATGVTARTPAHAPAQSLRTASSSTPKSRRPRRDPVSDADDSERQYSESNSPTPRLEVSAFPAEFEIVGPAASVLSNLAGALELASEMDEQGRPYTPRHELRPLPHRPYERQ
jgi:hypothetical protein